MINTGIEKRLKILELSRPPAPCIYTDEEITERGLASIERLMTNPPEADASDEEIKLYERACAMHERLQCTSNRMAAQEQQ